jgi:hypothetical protein
VKFVSRKKVAAAVAGVALLGGGIAAYAYFTSSGTGNGSAGVGTSTAFTVGNFSASGSLYPGDTTGAAVSYRITNPSSGHQGVQTVGVAVANDGGSPAVILNSAGSPVAGCLASWFSAGSSSFLASNGTTTVTLTADVAGGDYITGTTTVLMSNVGSSQDACKSVSPRITVTVG